MLNKRLNLASASLLVKNMSWLLSVEGAAKIARFITIFAMAAFLTPSEYGLAILCLAIHDIFRLLMRAGSGTQVIQCPKRKLKGYCQNAASIQWLLCIALAVIQFTSAPLLANFYQQTQASHLLQLMALSYLFYPAVSIKVYLLQRQNRFKEYSLINGCCIISENLLVAVLLWCDLGIVAIAYAKVASAILWFALFIKTDTHSYGFAISPAIIKFLLKTSSLLMLTELSKATKQHADVFVAGRLLPPELFGFYTFAKSASLGLSQSFINAFQGALLPYLSEQNRQGKNSDHKQVIGLNALLSLTFTAQALLAQFYIPLLFGQQWQGAVIACSILCLCAIPILWLDTFCCALRAHARYGQELAFRLFSLAAFATGLMLLPLSSNTDFALFTTVMSVAIALVCFTAFKQGRLNNTTTSLPLDRR